MRRTVKLSPNAETVSISRTENPKTLFGLVKLVALLFSIEDNTRSSLKVKVVVRFTEPLRETGTPEVKEVSRQQETVITYDAYSGSHCYNVT